MIGTIVSDDAERIVQGIINNAFGDEIWVTVAIIAIIILVIWYFTIRKPIKEETAKKNVFDKEIFWLVLSIVFIPVLSFFLWFTYHFYFIWKNQPQNIDFSGWLMLAIPVVIISILAIVFSILKISRLRSLYYEKKK